MPALADVPQTMRLNLFWSSGSPLAVFGGSRTFWQYGGTPPNAGVLQTFAQQVESAWVSNMLALQSTNTHLTEIVVTDLSSQTAAQFSMSVDHVGTRAGDELPFQDCVLVNYHIGRRYRGGKPRSYLPLGVAEDVSLGKTWTGTFAAAFGTAYQLYLNAVSATLPVIGNGHQMSVPYYKGHKPGPGGVWDPNNVPAPNPAPVPDLITGWSMSPYPGAQRRRQRYGS